MFNLPSGLSNATALPAPQVLPEGQPTQSAWGNFGGFVNSALGNAMNVYAQYEGIQAMKNAAGVAREEQSNTTELENGAAVVVDVPKTQPTQAKATETMVFGFPQKQVIMAFGGLLVVGVLLKVAKS
ncbi:hypothetical protein FHG08_11530 [Pseudoalteromonas sp. Scap03]|uniref:hypothetical protein n=1 Tax=unclassified Pseudoalteromonas TaxID=194690 RepID=UPI0015B8AD19|nr:MULTISPECIES: hypothetical protein [unclassified Pseudoalteromonas]NWL16322.1 hypothetical protein [Pseudoalteromonas sp. Scap03]QLE81440.1 hypothetical protein FLM54_07785 [Pseudoalteromonas sp. Scap25]QLE89384.1 hypothetical protein FLM47_07780 [Pseudoalteromonas sp. Scap06]